MEKRRARGSVSDHHLKDSRWNSGRMQERPQTPRHQRSKFRWLQHHRISRDQSRESLDRWNRKRIIPRRHDADYSMWLSQKSPRFGLHGNVAMGHRFIAQETSGVFDQEAGGVQNDQDLHQERFRVGFPR